MSDYPITKDDELVLKSSGLQGAGSANGTGKAIGPTGLVKAVIMVSAVASGGTLDVHLESSSDDAATDAYADIPNAAFTQITAVGVYELFFKSAEKWVRYAATVGTNNVTWQMLLGQANR
jgi:hypothetical protein